MNVKMKAWRLKGILIHIGEYLRPSIIDTKRPEEYEIKHAMFDDEGKVAPRGDVHVDPKFTPSFTYGDHPWKPSKANLGKLEIGDYIFFNCTFLEKTAGERARYIVGYFGLKEILLIDDIVKRHLTNRMPYCDNEHVQHLRDWGSFGTLFVGNLKKSKKLRKPIRLDRKLVNNLDLKDAQGNSIAERFDKKKDRSGRIMSEMQIISSYTRNPKILNERQVNTLLEMARKR